jgi:hypothetical protein
MAEQLFVFVQLEFPWALGPPDGRYLMRASRGGPPERVIVLEGTTPNSQPAPPRTTRVTVIDPVSLSAESQARAWLTDFEGDAARHRGCDRAINRMLLPTAWPQPTARAGSPHRRWPSAGWGEEGHGSSTGAGRTRTSCRPWRPRRTGVLRAEPPRSRASALSHVDAWLRCWARTDSAGLRGAGAGARRDLNAGRPAHAALELQSALAAAVSELRAEERHDLALRIDELEQLSGGVEQQAAAARGGGQPDGEVIAHALGRLEAVLRARQLRL